MKILTKHFASKNGYPPDKVLIWKREFIYEAQVIEEFVEYLWKLIQPIRGKRNANFLINAIEIGTHQYQ